MTSRLGTLLWTLATLAIFLAVIAYAGTYWRLRTRGLRDAQEWGLKGFYYVPIDENTSSADMKLHLRLIPIFAPLNWADQQILDGPAPAAELDLP